jgi:DNA modification methylase
MMVPARVALALQDDGWYLRSDTIWHKPNPMPESVTDRPTSAHEHIFLLTKRSRYYYDADAIREANAREWDPTNNGWNTHQTGEFDGKILGRATMPHSGLTGNYPNPAGRNCRNVWTIATAPYKEAHFATFPPELPRRCILAGTSEKGACAACGVPWVRCVERTAMGFRPSARHEDAMGVSSNGVGTNLYGTMTSPPTSTTTGWRAGCECDAGAVPCVVLDPFAGAGTALLVADRLGRDAIGVELNPDYAALIERRLTEDAPMFVEFETVAVPTQAVLL